MPPLVIEAGIAAVLISSIVKLTTTVNRIEAKQDRTHVELIGKHEVLNVKLNTLEANYLELKQEIKETRKYRASDIS